MDDVLRQLRRLAVLSDNGSLSDGQLLECFLAHGEEAAFEGLVRRHGPMVWGVCRRVLGHAHDAEDAFQATFLVLVRKGASIQPRERVGNWLYGVAFRTAQKARTMRARRRARESQAQPVPVAENDWNDLAPVLDAELCRLPADYRAAVVLCDLEGKSRKEAARTLGWPEGTLSGRLARARALLAERLRARGITLSAATLALVLAEQASAGDVPATLMQAAVQAGLLVAAGKTAAGVASSQAITLTQGVVRAMLWTKFRTVAVVLVGVSVLGTGMGRFTGPMRTEAVAATATAEAAANAVEEAAGDDNAVTVRTLPPVVVKTTPEAGDTAVDAATTKEIRVTFSKVMAGGQWSWSQISDETFPKVNGKPSYEKDRKTCVLPVQLEAGKTYVIWLNSERFKNFTDAEGRPAVPYLLVFQTK